MARKRVRLGTVAKSGTPFELQYARNQLRSRRRILEQSPTRANKSAVMEAEKYFLQVQNRVKKRKVKKQ